MKVEQFEICGISLEGYVQEQIQDELVNTYDLKGIIKSAQVEGIKKHYLTEDGNLYEILEDSENEKLNEKLIQHFSIDATG